MKLAEYKLDNGYSIVFSVGLDPERPKQISVEVYDADGVYNQDLVLISNYIADEEGNETYDSERFCISVPIDTEAYNDFIINLLHNKEELEVEEASETEETINSIKPGAHGEEVKKIQRRLKELGYFNGEIGGNYLTKTETAVKEFQKDNGLQIDGECDEITYNRLFSDEVKKKKVNTNESYFVEPAHGTAKVMDWWTSGIQKIFSKGTIATFTDVETGKAWRVRAKNGTNHRDWEPLTAQDTAIFKSIVKKWSWDRRPVFVTINGVNYAASINCMPHSSSSIDNNNYPGHSCCHFKNSRTHCSNKVCPKHQAAINKAAKANLE